MDKIINFFTSETFIALAFFTIALMIVLVVVLLVQARVSSKSREVLLKDLAKSQENLFSEAAAQLSAKLVEYTDNILLEKLNSVYETLITKDLLPSVNEAARINSELSQNLTSRQANEMEKLADHIAASLSSEIKTYASEQEAVIKSLQGTTVNFAEKLGSITATIQAVSLLYNEFYERSAGVEEAVGKASEKFAQELLSITEVLNKTAETAEKTQSLFLQTGEAINQITSASAQIQNSATNTALLLTEQNKNTAEIISNAVSQMQQNTESAAAKVLEELNLTIGKTENSIGTTITELKNITDNISQVSSQFSNAILSAHTHLDEHADQRLQDVSTIISAATSAEYERLSQSSQEYSLRLSQDIERLNQTLDGHIFNLNTVSQQLMATVSSFKNDVDESSGRFELGMEKSVTGALHAMDSSLAEIIKRLIAVTDSISEAADALPRAVKQITAEK